MPLALTKLRLLGLVVVLVLVAAFAQVYKWVDEEGVVHYGDSPPEDVESEAIQLEVRQSERADATVSELVERAEERAKRRAEAKQEESVAAEAQAQQRLDRQKRCKYSRKQLISLQQKLPVYRDEEGTFRTLSQYDVYEGKREYLDDAARQAEIKRVQRDIAASCDDPDARVDQFVAGWERMMSKRCEAARAGLKSLERPESRSSRQAIEEARRQVDEYCENEH